jgi:hypothetical protein
MGNFVAFAGQRFTDVHRHCRISLERPGNEISGDAKDYNSARAACQTVSGFVVRKKQAGRLFGLPFRVRRALHLRLAATH